MGRVTKLRYWSKDDTAPGAYAGLLQEIEDWRERKVTYRYDANGRLTTVLLPLVKAAAGVPAAYDFSTEARRPRIVYDYAAAPSATSDLAGFLDLGANLKSIVDPAQALAGAPRARVAFEYGADAAKRDRVTKQTWGTGETATFDYQSDARVRVTDALNQSTDYDLTGQPTVEIAKMTQLLVPVLDFAALPEKASPGSTPLTTALETSFTYGPFGELRTITYPNGRRETITRRVVGGIPGTVAGSIAEEGGTAHVTSFEYREDGESPASPTKITQSEGGNTGVTRDSLAPSRAHLKTGTSDVNEGATVGQESEYGPTGQLTANRTLSTVPNLASDERPTGIVRETTISYKDARSNNQHERGAVDTISIAGTRAVTHAVDGFDLAGEKVVTKDERRDVTTTVETDANDRVVHSAIADGTLGDEHFGYDAAGRLAYSSRKQSGATIETTIEYDAVGRAIAT
ncbi:MAG TPA: hypothetical protein VN605_07225, partial [Thermoanaerobaculia bacterium]|nr:hypothetical protein [Thermoanaerobaculia bacterium]